MDLWDGQAFVSFVKDCTCFFYSCSACAAYCPRCIPSPVFDVQDTTGTQEEAEGLVDKCLLQDVGGGGYRVHDLVLDFVKIKIQADVEMVKKVTALQARFLGRLDVLKGYGHPEHGAGNQGLFVLDGLWRSAEQLSGDPELEVASYNTSLGELESCEATTDVARSYHSVGFFFFIQVRHCLGIPCLLCGIVWCNGTVPVGGLYPLDLISSLFWGVR